jgi:hypothetical protein
MFLFAAFTVLLMTAVMLGAAKRSAEGARERFALCAPSDAGVQRGGQGQRSLTGR